MSSRINEEYITNYIRSIVPERSIGLRAMETYALKNHVPIIEPEVGQLLKLILKIKKPKRILEIGTAIGYSSSLMAETIDSVEIITIERREDMVKLAETNISKLGYEDRIRVLHGDAEEVLDNLDGTFDLIFLDAAKGQYLNFLEKSLPYLKKEGLVISDNVLFKGMVASDELVVRRKKTIVKRLREYLDYINEMDGYISSIIPIGDGVALTYREE